MKVYILEDDELMSANLERMLVENFDASVTQCLNASDFVSMYEDQADLLIVDIMINNTNMLEVLNRYVSVTKPIIFITAFPSHHFLNFTKLFVNSILLVKPIHELSLLNFVLKFQENMVSEQGDCLIVGTSSKRKEALPYSNINYVDVRGNYSIISTDTKKYILKKSISRLVSESKGVLLKLNKNIAVNVKYLNQINTASGSLKIMDKKFVVSDKYFKWHHS